MSIYEIGLFFKENVKTISMFPETQPFLNITEAYTYRGGVGSRRKEHRKRQGDITKYRAGHFLSYMYTC